MLKINAKLNSSMVDDAVKGLLSQDISKNFAKLTGQKSEPQDFPKLNIVNSQYKFLAPQFFTNERDTYMDYVSGKSALVITGGGDQILDLVFRGFTNFVAIDVNLVQIFVLILKLQSVKLLNYVEFNRFWNPQNEMCFDFDVIKRLLTESDEDILKYTLEFWQRIFENYNYCARDVRYHHILGECSLIDHKHNRVVIPEYAEKEKNFRKTRSAIKSGVIQIELVCADIYDYTPEDKFDFIHLSNLYNFNQPKQYLETVRKLIENNLNNGGKLATYIIQLDKRWVIDREARIPTILIRLDNKHTFDAINQHCFHAHQFYKEITNLYSDVRFYEVKTGNGYAAFYNTTKDLVLVVTK